MPPSIQNPKIGGFTPKKPDIKSIIKIFVGFCVAIIMIYLGWAKRNIYFCEWLGWGCKTSNQPKETLYVEGSQLKDSCGNPIVLVGVNKMSIFRLTEEPDATYFKEIAKTGANCVRIAWGIRKNEVDYTTPVELDSIISKCRQQNLIPIVGLWDYTDDEDGGFSKLNEYINFWKNPQTVNVLKKYQKYLIINIANEASVDGFDTDTFLEKTTPLYIQKYSEAIQQIRNSTGLDVPIMIDGLSRGKSLKCFSYKRNNDNKTVAQELLNADTAKNLIFSAHVYWNKTSTDNNSTFISDTFNEAVSNKFCFVLGEISKYGAYTGKDSDGNPNPICVPEGEVDYLQFLNLCHTHKVGYLTWEWGPGNDAKDATCKLMNMTSDSKFTGLQDWAIDVVENNIYGIRANATPLPNCK